MFNIKLNFTVWFSVMFFNDHWEALISVDESTLIFELFTRYSFFGFIRLRSWFFNTINFLFFNINLLSIDRTFFNVLTRCGLQLRVFKLLFNCDEVTGIGLTSSISINFDFCPQEMLITVFSSGKFLVGTTPLNKLWTLKHYNYIII